MRDVTKGVEKREKIDSSKVVFTKGKYIVYTQELLIERRGNYEVIEHEVKIKSVRSKVGKKVIKQAVLKTIKPGNLIRNKKNNERG